MYRIILLLVLGAISFLAKAQPSFNPEYNEYGEVKIKMTRSIAHPWTDQAIPKFKDSLIKYLGEGMYYEVLNHSSLDKYPESLNTPNKLSGSVET